MNETHGMTFRAVSSDFPVPKRVHDQYPEPILFVTTTVPDLKIQVGGLGEKQKIKGVCLYRIQRVVSYIQYSKLKSATNKNVWGH